MSSRHAGACWLVLGLACQGDDWIIAGELPASAEPPAMGSAPELIEELAACPSAAEVAEQRREFFGAGNVAAEHLGRWRGQLGGDAASGFPGSAVELRIDAAGTGTLTIGDASGAPFAAEGGVDSGYLCGAATSGVVCGSTSGFVGGFAYPIEAARSRDAVLSFTVVAADPWGPWCARQEPVRWEDSRQACGFAFGVRPPAELRYSALGCSRVTPEGDAEPIDCALMYALEFCACARDACFASFARIIDVGLEQTPDGTSLSGSLWYENEIDAAPIVLDRVP